MFMTMVSYLIMLVCISINSVSWAETKLVVDFGGNAQGNVFNSIDFPGWNNVSFSSHTDYTTGDSEGLTMVSGADKYDNWQSISGSEVNFKPGDTIIASWFNVTGGVVSLWRPLISFVDTNYPSETQGDPQWYAMDRYGTSLRQERNVNYLQDGSTVQTVYTITSSDTAPGNAPPSAGNHTVINICNRNANYKGLILDKIDIVKAADSTPLPPVNVGAERDVKLPHGRIKISWDPVSPVGGVAIDHYRVYRNNLWVGRSDEEQFWDSNLEPGKSYTYAVEAVNIFRSRSGPSQLIAISTAPFTYKNGAINPERITYLGAFRFPSDTQGSSWNYRRGQLAYYPDGDPNEVDGDHDFPGSLYGTGHTYDKMGAEISIPHPVVATNPENLPRATTLQHFHEIEPANTFDTNYVSVGLTYLTQNKRFYSTFYYWYNVSFKKMITHGAFLPDFSDIDGGWWVGQADDDLNPRYDTYAKFLSEIPENWASENTPEKYLLSGGQRAGSAPDGPGLVAIDAWGEDGDDIPEANEELSYTTLLEYKSDGIDTMNGWIDNDYFDGVAWVVDRSGAAVVFGGQKAYGEYFYGFQDGTIYQEVIHNVPANSGTDGGSKGGQARSYRAMLLFYDPDELARVAKSQSGIYHPDDPLFMEPHQPQPYGVADIDDFLFRPNPNDPSGGTRVESVTYDPQRGYLFIVEPNVFANQEDCIHVFGFGTGAESQPLQPIGLRLD